MSHLCKVFCLFFSSLLVIQLSVLQINCLISVPHSQGCWGYGKPGSCIPVLLGGKCCVLLLGMPYYHMVTMLIKLTERAACLLVHLEECLVTNRISSGKISGRKSEDTFLSFKEIFKDNWYLIGSVAHCHGEIHIQTVTNLLPKVCSLAQEQNTQNTQG